ncbi:asparagine synthase-related protein, partial [Leclercia adecarboxylata]|uniref:asparagine synthase-related protein n=1 Tax=Leclercia adecarboxylata TaxID=83655 RepID=UPI00234CC629
GKYVLKEAARQVIPAEVIDRPKGYFPVPGLKHLQGATLNWVREMLLDPSQERGLYKPQALEKLLADPDGQLTPLRGSKLWQLAAVNLWLSEQGLGRWPMQAPGHDGPDNPLTNGCGCHAPRGRAHRPAACRFVT